MSSFKTHARNEELNRDTDILWIDDYYAPHDYAVFVPKFDSVINLTDEINEDYYDVMPPTIFYRRGWELVD